MKIRFLQDCAAPITTMWYCGDVCNCSHIEWKSEVFIRDEEYNATHGYDHDCQQGLVNVDSLIFGKDYTIIEFP